MHTDLFNKSLTYAPLGEQVVLVQFENTLSTRVNQQVQSFGYVIEHGEVPGVKEVIVTLRSLAITYDSTVIGYDELVEKLKYLEDHVSEHTGPDGKLVHIPVVFGGRYGPDLETVADQIGLTPEEVIKLIHSSPYYVYMIGFSAGLPYCGDLDDRLALPRRSEPRPRVKKGTVGIAKQQTVIYTIDSPAGWHLMGWTPMEMFSPHKKRPSILQAGDRIQYVPISSNEAEQWDDNKQREWNQKWNTLRS